eukprot:14458539-Alexandrium_andersonii.AAC.1
MLRGRVGWRRGDGARRCAAATAAGMGAPGSGVAVAACHPVRALVHARVLRQALRCHAECAWACCEPSPSHARLPWARCVLQLCGAGVAEWATPPSCGAPFPAVLPAASSAS